MHRFFTCQDDDFKEEKRVIFFRDGKEPGHSLWNSGWAGTGVKWNLTDMRETDFTEITLPQAMVILGQHFPDLS